MTRNLDAEADTLCSAAALTRLILHPHIRKAQAMNLFDTHCHLDFNPTCLDRLFLPLSSSEAPADYPHEVRPGSLTDDAQPSTGDIRADTYVCRKETGHASSNSASQDAGAAESPAESTPQQERARMRFLCMTCSPYDFARAKARFAENPAVHVACGLHPRWIAEGTCGPRDVEQLCALIARERIIGEVGLDFLPAYEDSREDQLCAFDRIVRTCAQAGGKVLSIHALRSADCVLDTLERYRTTENCQCVMHWFSGSSEQLHRAIKAGCWFSVNRRMLTTKKGHEYARIIPENRLLLESDLPSQPCESAGPEEIAASLGQTLELLAQIRGKDCGKPCFRNANNLLEAEM